MPPVRYHEGRFPPVTLDWSNTGVGPGSDGLLVLTLPAGVSMDRMTAGTGRC